MLTNDNAPLQEGPANPTPDAHGHAALILVESLMHVLIERSAMSSVEAADVVETAIAVQADIAAIAGGAAPAMWRSHALLSAIATSFETIEPD